MSATQDHATLDAAVTDADKRVADLTADHARQSAEMAAAIERMAAALARTMDDLSAARAAADKARGQRYLSHIYDFLGK